MVKYGFGFEVMFMIGSLCVSDLMDLFYGLFIDIYIYIYL